MIPIAMWNSARDVWEVTGVEATTCLFCGHSDVYSETFPTSGTTRSGVAYALPTWAPRTAGSVSSSSPDDALLPTVTTIAGDHPGIRTIKPGQQMHLSAVVINIADPLLPTPRTSDTNGPGLHGDGGMDLRTAVTLMPTPRATDGTKGGPNQRGSSGDMMLPSAVQSVITDWGPYAPAIRRWEAVMGPAPAPTELNAKGNHRLSPLLTEWMMGVPAGWITGTPGVSRNDQLKAAGNGVVPQQAAAALADMLAAFEAREAAA